MSLLDQFGNPIAVRPHQVDTERQNALLSRLKALPLLDAAYLHELNDRGIEKVPMPHLRDIFSSHQGTDVVSAYHKACRLINDAYEFGDRHLAAKFGNGPELLAEMQERHPGFTNDTYQLTLLRGCQEAR